MKNFSPYRWLIGIAGVGLLTVTTWAIDCVPQQLLVKLRNPVATTALKTMSADPVTGRFAISDIQAVNLATSKPKTFSAAQFGPAVYKITFGPNVDLYQARRALLKDRNVIWADYNYKFKALDSQRFVPDDLLYGRQPNMDRVRGPQAWYLNRGNSAKTVAVVDTGVDWDHVDLVDKIWHNPGEIPDNGIDDDNNGFVDDVIGWDFVSVPDQGRSGEDYGPPDNNPMDFDGHGTHVAGIAAADTNNGLGVAGTGFNTSIMAIRAGYKGPFGGKFDLADICSALSYAVLMRADVINMSFGTEVPAGTQLSCLNEALDAAKSLGIVLVAAAGNDAANLDTVTELPAEYPGVIAVSMTDNSGNFVSPISNYGTAVWVAAPGESILSTAVASASDNNNYEQETGTSMSAPHVSGAAALILAVNASADVATALARSATDKGTAGKDPQYGWGLLNMENALRYVDPTPPTLNFTPVSGTRNTAEFVAITANITDNFEGDHSPSASVFYRFKIGSTVGAYAASKLNRVGNSSLFYGEIPSSDRTATEINYYLQIADGNPSNTFTSPSGGASVPYTVVLRDVTGPTMTSWMQTGDYVAADQTVTFSIVDNVAVTTPSISVVLRTATQQRTLTNADYAFSSGVLSVDLTPFSLTEPTVNLTVAASDPNDNRSTASVLLNLSDSSVDFDLFGGASGEAVVNVPNPFNPSNESTAIAYQITQQADIEVFIYSLGMARVFTYRSIGETPGYHEIEWDGRDTGGNIVPNGIYIFVIKGTNGDRSVLRKGKIAVLRR
jgi:subtilisin family serine protease